MAKSREELVLETLPEVDFSEISGTDLTDSISESVSRAEQSARRGKAREEYKRKFAEPEQDMAPVIPDPEVSKSEIIGTPPLNKVECEQLLRSMGIQTSVQLSRNDTYNLLASLLSCTENQIDVLLKSPQIPLSIKTILRRLKIDCQTGDVETINKLWDRLFGKGPLRDDLPNTGLVESGIFPNHPVSREAYALIVKKWQ